MIAKANTAKKIDYVGLILSCHDVMRSNNLNLVYEGEINQNITKAFTALAEQNLNEDKEEKSVVRKVYHVLVECLQNIYKHTDSQNPDSPGKRSNGVLLLGHDDNGYIVSTGNMVDLKQKEILIDLLDNINSLDGEELNMLYKKKMRDGMLSEKGGAGLGFIDISRKTNSKLEYHFETIDENKSFFILKTYIAK